MLSRYFRRYAMKKFTAVLLVLCMTLSILPAASAAGSYTDVPAGHWAENVIAKAAAYQIMLGKGGGRFGLGENVTRAEFAAMLTRIMGWERPSPAAPTFADNADPTQWYYAISKRLPPMTPFLPQSDQISVRWRTSPARKWQSCSYVRSALAPWRKI